MKKWVSQPTLRCLHKTCDNFAFLMTRDDVQYEFSHGNSLQVEEGATEMSLKEIRCRLAQHRINDWLYASSND